VSRYVFTRLAETDLEELVDYIFDHSGPERARSVLDDLMRAVDLLANMPGMGHKREDLTGEVVLFWPVHGYLIVYRPDAIPLEIVRVVSGRRDVEALLEGE